MKISNATEYDSAKNEYQQIFYSYELSSQICPPPISKSQMDREIELENSIIEYEMANGLFCPHCKTPDFMGAGCWECSRITPEDFI